MIKTYPHVDWVVRWCYDSNGLFLERIRRQDIYIEPEHTIDLNPDMSIIDDGIIDDMDYPDW